ncbi:hypothetical protein GCM10009675_20250 [Prauserella alba]|uniref:HNH nuclease domain-containing protein n=1 Tax=Prauserella alba TaxID=176898 RepID=A0ABN1VAT8_9PSEU
MLCDPGTGEPVDLGRTRRRPSATIRDLVRARDRECIMPWCHRPARHCDHDHEHPWATGGGTTSVANGGPRCRPHHRLKDQPGWNTHYDPGYNDHHTYSGDRKPGDHGERKPVHRGDRGDRKPGRAEPERQNDDSPPF